MIRLSPGSTLVLATHNSGKAREIAVFLAPWELLVFTAEELGLPEPEESGADFRENATLKAKAAAEAAGKTALADDSGLEVLALDGAPGIYSARWAGENRNFRAAMERLRNEFRFRDAREPWTARFVCALAVATPEGYCEVFEFSLEETVQGRCKAAAFGLLAEIGDLVMIRCSFLRAKPQRLERCSRPGRTPSAIARTLSNSSLLVVFPNLHDLGTGATRRPGIAFETDRISHSGRRRILLLSVACGVPKQAMAQGFSN